MDKKGFILYKPWRHLFAGLPAEMCAELINAIFAYQCGEEPVIENAVVQGLYNMMVEQFEDDAVKYEDVSNKRREAAQKRWAAEQEKDSKPAQTDANVCKTMQTDANDSNDIQTDAYRSRNRSRDRSRNRDRDRDRILEEKTPLRLSNDNLPPRGTETRPVPQKRFVPPTVEEVRDYCFEKGYDIDPEDFVAFYQSKGWMVGKNHMKDWKAATRTWVQRRKKEQKPDRLDGIRRWAEKGGGYDERRVCHSGHVDQGGVYESFS